jgi:hypothetical protein
MAPTRETVLKLTSFRYKKEGITEQEFHDYASKDHAPKAAVVQARHGALKVAQVRHGPPFYLTISDIDFSTTHLAPPKVSSRIRSHGPFGQAGPSTTTTSFFPFGFAAPMTCWPSLRTQTSKVLWLGRTRSVTKQRHTSQLGGRKSMLRTARSWRVSLEAMRSDPMWVLKASAVRLRETSGFKASKPTQVKPRLTPGIQRMEIGACIQL